MALLSCMGNFFSLKNTCVKLPRKYLFVWLKVAFLGVFLLIMFTVHLDVKQFQEIEFSIDFKRRYKTAFLGTIDIN